MIRCVAIDDEPQALKVIENHVARVDFLSLEGAFVDPFAAIAFVNENPVDLVFLDINMPDINGLQLPKHFTGSPLIIFTTAHGEHALASYELAAIDYLLKPFDFSRFLTAVTKVKDRFASRTVSEKNFFFVNTGNQKRRLFYGDILYIEGEGNYVRYVTPKENILVRASIKETLALLPAAMFIQIHRSYIVALQRIEKIEDNHVCLAGKSISIGAKYRTHFWQVIDGLN